MLGYRRGVRKLESRAAEPEKSANFGCLVNAGRETRVVVGPALNPVAKFP
jgi:hypothetical protein